MKIGQLAPPLAAVLFVVALGGVLGRAAPNESIVDMSTERLGWVRFPAELTARSNNHTGTHELSASLDLIDVSSVLRADAIDLRMATYGASLSLVRGRLALDGSDCVFDVAYGTTLRDNHDLRFTRTRPCGRPGESRRGRLDLAIVARAPSRAALWLLLPPAGVQRSPESAVVIANAMGPSIGHGWAQGRYVTTLQSDTATYAELLAFLWNGAVPASWWPWLLAVLGLALVLSTIGLTSGSRTLVHAVAAGTMACALAAAYAVLSPPFHAPDEPRHFIAFLNATGRTANIEPMRQLHLRNHVERIRARSDQRFRPAHREHPSAQKWREVQGTSESVLGVLDYRSPAAAAYWRALAPLVDDLNGAQTLLAVRVMNAAVFGLAIGLATLLVATRGSDHTAYAAILLAIPALPFFAMHVSNYALLASAYVMAAAGMTRLIATSVFSAATALTLTASLMLAMLTARSALPMVGVWLMVIPLRGLAICSAPRPSPMDTIAFWSSALLPLALLLPAMGSTIRIPDAVTFWTLSELSLSPGAYATGVVTLVVIVITVEMALTRRKWTLSFEWQEKARRGLQAAGATMMCGLTALLVVPQFVPVAPLRHAARDGSLQVSNYVGEVWIAAAGMFGGYPPDVLLVSTFWGGLGWLDTLPPAPLIATLVAAVGVLLFCFLWHAVVETRSRQLAAVVCLSAGLASSLTMYAAFSAATLDLMNGRYLVGWYLMLLAPVGVVVMEWSASRPGVRATAIIWCLVVQGIAMIRMLDRYFGP